MLKNFVNIIGIADPSEFPLITPLNPHTQYVVQETLEIPAAKPDVEQINSVMVEATITGARTIATPVGLKIVIDGELNQKVIYTADDTVQSVHSAHYVQPFCTFIEIPLLIPVGGTVASLLLSLGLTLNDVLVGTPKVLVEDLSVKLLDPRTVEKCTVLFIWATINSLLEPVLG